MTGEKNKNFSKNDKMRSKNFPSQQVILRATSGIVLHSFLPQKKEEGRASSELLLAAGGLELPK